MSKLKLTLALGALSGLVVVGLLLGRLGMGTSLSAQIPTSTGVGDVAGKKVVLEGLGMVCEN